MESKPTRAQVLETFAAFAAVSLLAAYVTHHPALNLLALAILLIALFAHPLARVVTRAWLTLSTCLSGYSNWIILAVLYYLLLAPLAGIYRLFNRDPLNLDMEKDGSFYVERNHTYCKNDLEKLW